MGNPGLTDAQITEAWEAYKRADLNISEAARLCGLNRATYVNRLEAAKRRFERPDEPEDYWTFPEYVEREVRDGIVIFATDAHVWPFRRSVSAQALLRITSALAPRVKGLVAGGDWMDGARSNRHDPHGWNKRPSVLEERDGVASLLHDWRVAAIEGGCSPELFTDYEVGNHDLNFERKLVQNCKEFEGLGGFRLADHFPEWNFQWSTRVNWHGRHPVWFSHRFRGGQHAAFNNTLHAGVTTCTGHTHACEVKPVRDFRGVRYGIQGGCLTDPDGPQFEYKEGNPTCHIEGFVVLTFQDGELQPPELCQVINGRAWFRGQVWAEAERQAA